jgi:hypothetical protein
MTMHVWHSIARYAGCSCGTALSFSAGQGRQKLLRLFSWPVALTLLNVALGPCTLVPCVQVRCELLVLTKVQPKWTTICPDLSLSITFLTIYKVSHASPEECRRWASFCMAS